MLLFVLIALYLTPGPEGQHQTALAVFDSAQACETAKAQAMAQLTKAGVPELGLGCTPITVAKVS